MTAPGIQQTRRTPEMAFNSTRTRVGEIRPSQLLRDFGVGALIDLPNISAVVLGLEDWESYYQQAQEISEERLLTFVRWWLGQQVARLRTPPVDRKSTRLNSSHVSI